MFVTPNHQFTQPCTSQTNGCQTHSVSAAKSPSVRLAQLSQISRPPSTRVFCHTAFPLGFLRCKQTEMFSICGCFSLIRAAKRGKERTCDQTLRKDQTMHEFCLQSSLDPNPHLCLSHFANCNCLPVIIRKVSLYSPAGKVLGAHLQGDLTKTPPSPYMTLSGQVMLENGQIGHVTLRLQRSSHCHDNTNSSLPAPTGPMSQSSSRGVGFQNTGSPPWPLRSRSRVQDAGRRALGVPLIRARPSAPSNRAPARWLRDGRHTD